ncbi:MAG: C39 family peptidase [Eubacteriales bacterium]|nr:C39 family peptidase [Eubacteriales bacterium]
MGTKERKRAFFLILIAAAGLIFPGGTPYVEAGSRKQASVLENTASVKNQKESEAKGKKKSRDKKLTAEGTASESMEAAETSGKGLTEKHAQETGANTIISKIVKEPTKIPAEKTIKEPTKIPAEKTIKEPAKVPAEKTTKEPAGKESDAAAELPEAWQIEQFPIILQNPELPTGCEITALAMVLDYYGFEVDKTTLAEKYLPKTTEDLYQGEDGRLYGPDLNKYFVGDPFDHGLICGTEAIVTAADTYLQEVDSKFRGKDLTGTAPEELYQLISQNMPAVVWVTIYMEDRWEPEEGWYTEEGEYVDWSTNDHGAVLVGYTEKTVSIADPISGLVEYPREQFELVYASRGCKSVILQKQ